MKREQGKKASQKSKAKFNALCVAAAQGQAGSSRAARVRSLKREFIKRVAEANSPEAVRQIYAKWQGKFKANSSQI
ncbi:hypothetical protein C0861_01620 [Campylobacter upsaliensis]|nr:hypothetical protein [Campylobacter upsaliensis]